MTRGYTGWTYITRDPKRIDTIIRSCFNVLSQKLVTQYITVISNPVNNPSLPIDEVRFKQVATTKIKNTFSVISTEDTQIGYIETTGNFTSATRDEFTQEITSVTYATTDPVLSNDLVVILTPGEGIYTIGDQVLF